MKAKNEEYCKSTFDTFLRAYYTHDEVAWRPGCEPPDYYLSLQGQLFDVEVTTLVGMVKRGSPKPLSWIGVLHAFQDTVADVEKLARHDDVLHGAYAIAFGEPIDDFGKWKYALKRDLLGSRHCLTTFEIHKHWPKRPKRPFSSMGVNAAR